ncbi:MAG: type II toxin-antitoxin system VapC family toxin [Aestuariivirga sp.]|uniref:type II toxin-antitoxin system VapC family toxin n=1 Tax=Aestuariivirga sp. TaxID=2650926 RepID=UPI0038D20F4F
MKYLVDTNVISEIRKGSRCNRGVSAWYATVVDEDLCISVLVLGEIRKGIELRRSRDPRQAQVLEEWLYSVTEAFGERALPIETAITDEWGRLNAVRPIPVLDGLLAATAMVHGLTLVTRNESDVVGLGAAVLNPFT